MEIFKVKFWFEHQLLYSYKCVLSTIHKNRYLHKFCSIFCQHFKNHIRIRFLKMSGYFPGLLHNWQGDISEC